MKKRESASTVAVIILFSVMVTVASIFLPCCTVTDTGSTQPVNSSNTLTADALFKKAMNLYRMGKTVESIETFHKFIALYSDDPRIEQAHYWIVRCREGSISELTIALNDFIKKYPNSKLGAELKFDIAKKYWDKQDFDNAKIQFEEAIAQFNNQKDVVLGCLDKLRDIYQRTGDNDNLISTLDRIVETAPESEEAPRALFQVARVYEKKGDYVSAYYTYIRLQNIYPEFRSSIIMDKIKYYEADYDKDGIPNVEEMQAGRSVNGRR